MPNWPSLRTLALWCVAAVAGIVWGRWQGTIAHAASLGEVVGRLIDDVPYLLGVLATGALVLVPVRLLGWARTLGDPGGDDH